MSTRTNATATCTRIMRPPLPFVGNLAYGTAGVPPAHDLERAGRPRSGRDDRRSGQAVAHVTAIGRPFGELVVVGGDGAVVRAFEVEAEPAIDHEADGNIGDGEGIAAHVGPAAVEMVVELAHLPGDLVPPLLDEPRIVPRRLVQHAAQERAA